MRKTFDKMQEHWSKMQLTDIPESSVRLKVFRSKGKTIYAIVLASVLLYVGVSLCLLSPVTALMIGWWCVLITSLFLYKFAKQLLSNGPELVLTDAYIENASWPYKRIQWKNISACTKPG